MKNKNHSIEKYTVIVIIFVLSIVVFGVSVSYSFFSINVEGDNNVTPSQTAHFEVTSTINDAPAINAAELALIDSANYQTEAQKVEFSVTNSSTSDAKAKYTIELVEMSLTKNLASKYFKWALVVDGSTVETGDFADSSIAPEGTSDTTVVSNLSKALISEEDAITLDIGATDDLVFYIWLENDDSVDQIYLTNGDFSGKLSMKAVPTR